MNRQKESIELESDWRLFIVPFFFGFLLIPVFGAGIWIIVHYRRKWMQMQYLISNSDIRIHDGSEQTTLQLHRISSCEVQYRWPQHRFGLGNILLRHENGVSLMHGIRDPEPVASLIERAAISERDRMMIREEVERTRPQHPSGTLDKKNELVGLWQQGLLGEEDYRQEIKKFGEE